MGSRRIRLTVAGLITLIIILSCNSPTAPTATLPTSVSNLTPESSAARSTSTTISPSPTAPATETTIIPASSAVMLETKPTAESLKATVTADLLSCRYGPGSEYLFLYGLRKGANIKLIGRTDGNNWVYVDGKNKCWVNVNYIEIAGDRLSLPVVYPGIAKLPVSPYYPPTIVRRVTRTKNQVTVEWADIPLRAGDEEDASMQHYIVEVWHCEGGQIIFDPLATNDLSVTFVDEPGCSEPSRGRIFVQEKHGFAGPTEIPWPAYQ
jgi:uncharacterized protein YraI